jgi:hypothetical protein
LPLYFTSGEEAGGRNDFLGRPHNGQTLKSFSINPGGYSGFFDPATGQMDTFSMKGDAVAARRLQVKLKTETARISRHRIGAGGRLGQAAKAAKRAGGKPGRTLVMPKPRQTKVTVKTE